MIEVNEGGTFTVLHNGERIDIRIERIVESDFKATTYARLNIVDIPRGSTVEIVTK